MLLRLFPGVRPSELQRFRFFLILSGLMFASQTTAMTVCESLLLSRMGLRALPYSVLVASALTMLCSYLYSRWVGKHRNEDSLLRLIAIAVVIILGSVSPVLAGWQPAYVAIFAFHFVTFTVISNHLQALSNDYFDTLSSKRILPLIGVGATLGEITGGLSASGVTRYLPIESLLFMWAGFLTLGAIFTVLHRTDLRVWNPHPESLHSDDSERANRVPVKDMLKRSALNRTLLGSVCAMILTMSMVQYVVSDVFVTSFPKDADLAAFLGVFVAAANALELLLASYLTPRLLRRLGVAWTNTIHAVLGIATLIFLWADYSLVPAILAWINRKTVSDALAGPTRRLVFNAVPLRERGPLMAFVMGVAGSAARAAASLTLMVLQQSLQPRSFILFGLVFGLAYLGFVWRVAGHYLGSLLEEIRKGRLSLRSTRLVEDENLELLWSESLKQPDGADFPTLADTLMKRGRSDLLRAAALTAAPSVRVVCAERLGAQCPPECLRAEEPRVRLAAARALWRDEDLIRPLMNDPDGEVREMARVICGESASSNPDLFPYFHQRHLPDLVAILEGDSPPDMVPALQRLSGESVVSLDTVFRLVDHRSQEVGLAAVESLAGWRDPLARVLLARCLEHRIVRIRNKAADMLSGLGPSIIAAVKGYFRSEREGVVESAYRAFSGMSDAQTRELLGQELRLLVRQAWKNLALHSNLERLEQEDLDFLRLALRDRAARCERLAFELLALLEGESVVGSVRSSLRFGQGASRSTALEVLSNLGDREAAGLLVLLTEPAPLEERLNEARRQSSFLAGLPSGREGILAECVQSSGRFVSRAALEPCSPGAARLLRLSSIDLFENLSLEVLEQMDSLLTEERFATNQEILRRGEASSKLYLVWKGGDGRSVLGEAGAVDGGPSLRTVRALEPTLVYSLSTANLQDLILRQPSVAFPLITRLTADLRSMEREVAALTE